MLRLFCLVILPFLFSGCQTMIKPEVVDEINNRFNIAKEQREQNAKAGKMTWVQAQSEIKDLDKGVKERLDATGAIHTWRYDSGDDEYYAYCIALAEQLDRKQISFAEFDALRIERFNAIETRRQSLNAQQQLLNAQQQLINQNSLNQQNSRIGQPANANQNSQMQQPSFGGQSGSRCDHKREWISGGNRHCVYSCVLGGEVIQTVSDFQSCPFWITR